MNNLQLLRNSANLSFRELQSYTGINYNTLRNLEVGKIKFREMHIMKLCFFFDVSAEFLLGYKDTGVGVYYLYSEDGNDHDFISYADYLKFKTTYGSKESIVERQNEHYNETVLPKEIKSSFIGKYNIYREIQTVKEKANIPKNIIADINAELNQLNNTDLKKVLNFIKDYIK